MSLMPTFSLRSLLTLLVGLLALAALAQATLDLGRSWTAHRGAILLAERNRMAERCLDAVKDFAFERGRSNVVLRGQDIISAANRRFIDERRSGADSAIAAVLAALPDDLADAGGPVRESWEELRRLRAEVDRDFVRPPAERDPALVGRWFAAASQLIARIEALLVQVSRVPGADGSFDRLSNLRLFALQFRNLVGTESTRLAAALSARRVPDAALVAEIHTLRGRSMQLWLQIERGEGQVADARFSAALAKVQDHFFGRLRPLQDEILQAAAAGRIASVGVEQYTAMSVAALDSAIEAVDSIGTVAGDFAAANLEEARRAMMDALAIIAGTLLLTVVSLPVIARRFTGPLRHIVERIRALIGEEKPVAAGAPADEFAQVGEALAMLEDSLAARRRAEEELRVREEKLAGLFRLSPLGIALTDMEGRFLEFNDAFRHICGYSDEEILHLDYWALTPAEYKEQEELQLESLRREGRYGPYEKEYRHKDGHRVPLRLNGIRVTGRDGRDYTWSIVEDISASRRAEEQLRAAKEAAEAASQAKSRFLAAMSHEIRTPMNGVLGMAQMLLSPGVSETERLECARTILNSGQTLLTLLNDILDLSKVEAGKIELESIAFEPAQILREIAALFAESARAKALQMDIGDGALSARRYCGDPLRLRQMLSNLVSNAVKFTERGSVLIEVREVESDARTALLEFAVTDTGIGIPGERQAALYQPFSQIDASSTRQFGGTGLGLSIVRSLAQLMGGEVGLSSRIGEGSCFWFRIRVGQVEPGTDTRQGQRVPAAEATAAVGRAGCVLVAEDNAVNRKVMAAMLGKLGIEVRMVENGQEAVELLTQGGESFDLALMDVHMPVMDGLEATRRLRRWEQDTGRPQLPVVAVTASAFAEDRKRCAEAGMDDFLSKPLSLNVLSEMLARWLPRREAGANSQPSPAASSASNAATG